MGRCKLTEEETLEMTNLVISKLNPKRIAAKIGVSLSTVYNFERDYPLFKGSLSRYRERE